jgi:hypothetical protein
MEMIMSVINYLVANGASIVQALLQVLGGFLLLAKLTPTEADDKFIQKILDLIHLGALNIKK